MCEEANLKDPVRYAVVAEVAEVAVVAEVTVVAVVEE